MPHLTRRTRSTTLSRVPDVQNIIEDRFRAAIVDAFGPEFAQIDPLVRPAANPQFGDYQANVAMSLAKQLGRKPRDVAQAILDKLQLDDVSEKLDIAGPGFVNITLAQGFLDEQLAAVAADERLGVPTVDKPDTVVVDYSGPNVAKEMHIGHLRSTIIGDAIVRVLDFQGRRTIRQNHIGDWGTQFGMLIEHLITSNAATEESIGDLNTLYREAKQRFDEDPDFAQRARQRVVALQSGDETSRAIWMRLVNASKAYFQTIYERLGVLLQPDDARGESFYNDRLTDTVRDLEAVGLARESEGALVVYPQGFVNPEGEPLGMIVRKSDGGFLYATTDLAAARYRIHDLHADRIIYVTDSRQSQHFAMVFQTLREANWTNERVRLDHVPFGTILGKDRKPFKTREGGVVRLADVLDEAERRASAIVAEKNPELSPADRDAIARAVGIGALKYADLSNDRIKDYVFDWDRMLSFEGNTAPYLQNAYVRIRAIFRKVEAQGLSFTGNEPLHIREPAERQLALRLFQFPAIIASVAETLEPHRLCNYLYDLAAAYHQFYEKCPVIKADDATRASRLRLSDTVARTLRTGLGLLGIDVVEQM